MKKWGPDPKAWPGFEDWVEMRTVALDQRRVIESASKGGMPHLRPTSGAFLRKDDECPIDVAFFYWAPCPEPPSLSRIPQLQRLTRTIEAGVQPQTPERKHGIPDTPRKLVAFNHSWAALAAGLGFSSVEACKKRTESGHFL
jgi:hypothetical protein